MCAPASAAAAARCPAPSPLPRVACPSSASARSTFVHAAQLITASGRESRTAARTASASVMSRSARARATTSWADAAATTSVPSMPAAPVTRRRMATSIAQTFGGAKGQRELDPGLRILEPVAEELAQLLEPVADGLGVDLERGGDRLDLPGPVQIRAERDHQPFPRAFRERVERREPRPREVGGDAGSGGEEQRGQVLV